MLNTVTSPGAPGASVPRPSRITDSGPVVNSSTMRASVILPGVHQFLQRQPDRRFQPDDAERAALELLHLLAARDAARGRSRSHRSPARRARPPPRRDRTHDRSGGFIL